MTTRMAAVVVAFAAGCVDQTDAGGTWVAASEIDGSLAPEIGPTPGLAAPAGCELRIATWNVHFGADVDDLAERIQRSSELARADVILTQEIEAYASEPGTRTARLASALGMTWVYAPARTEGDGTHGIAILSRYPLERPAIRQLPHFDQPWRPRERNAMRAEVVLAGVPLTIVNVHLDVRLGVVDRIRQLDPAVQQLEERAVVGGDFNTNPWAWYDGLIPLTATEAIVGQQQAVVIDDYLADNRLSGAIAASVATMRLPAWEIRTDNLYARDVAIRASGVEQVDGSDHWPLWFDVSVCD